MKRVLGLFDTVCHRIVIAFPVPIGEELIGLELTETELRRPLAIEIPIVGQVRYVTDVARVADVVVFIFFRLNSAEPIKQVIGERIRRPYDHRFRLDIFDVLGVDCALIVGGIFPIGELGQRRVLLLRAEGSPLFAGRFRRIFHNFGGILVHLVLFGSGERDVLLGRGAPLRRSDGRPCGGRVGTPNRWDEFFRIARFGTVGLKSKTHPSNQPFHFFFLIEKIVVPQVLRLHILLR